MSDQLRVVTFDVDAESLNTLRAALPEWAIEPTHGATDASLLHDWNPATVGLLVVGARTNRAETLSLCRGLRSQAGRAVTPLLVLVPPGQPDLVTAVLAAGADGCLVLPVHAKELASMVARAEQGNQPGRHTLDLSRAQREDPWRDHGGQG